MTRLAAAACAFVVAAGMAAGCATRPRGIPLPRSPVLGVTLLDTLVLPVAPASPGGRADRRFGSLSGLARDPRSGRYLAVIDDRQPSRLVWLDITVKDGRLSATPGDVIPLEPGRTVDPRIVTGADLEAIVALTDGTWVASEEGHVSTGAADQPPKGEWPPALLTFDARFRVTRVQPWPARFALDSSLGGVRENQGFESLSRTPDGRLIAGLEQPLRADMPAVERNGRPFGGGQGGPGRLFELVRTDGVWRVAREWVYPIDPTATREGFDRICDDGENGLTELLALDTTRLIALERACLLSPDGRTARNTGRLYLADTEGAEDVSPAATRSTGVPRPVAKTLLVDFESLVWQWPPELVNLDNFEAMAFGPTLPDGRRTFIVLSDDNFRATQRTVFLWFRIDEIP